MPEMPEENALTVTLRHMKRVQDLLGMAAQTLIQRGVDHDLSKLTPEELGPLQALRDHQAEHGQAAFGTPEYEQQRAMLGPMLEHHYANNTHHPEHYENGISGMDLFDVMEMFFDWKAASERGGEEAINLTASAERFGIDPQLLIILYNTARSLGYETK